MLLFTCILSLASCSKDDGDWDAMKWEKNNYEEALTPSFGKAIGVPKLGGTYTFKCKNYKNFWIVYVNEQVRDKTIKYVPAYDDKLYSEVKGSFTSSKVEGNTLTVTFAPNETQDGRYVRVEVSAGDIFDRIIFVQKPEKKPLPCHPQGAGVPACCVWGDSGVFPFPSPRQQRVNDCRLYNQRYVIYEVISFLYRRSRTFFTANGGLFAFAPFQPAIRQARRGMAENIRELALEILPAAY